MIECVRQTNKQTDRQRQRNQCNGLRRQTERGEKRIEQKHSFSAKNKNTGINTAYWEGSRRKDGREAVELMEE